MQVYKKKVLTRLWVQPEKENSKLLCSLFHKRPKVRKNQKEKIPFCCLYC